MKELIVDKKFNNKKLNAFLLATFNGLSLNMLYKALRQKDIIVNGTRVKENVTVFENDKIKIFISDEYLFRHFSLDIVYEDANILVVNKPVGIEVVNLKNDTTITSILKEKYTFIEPCHRLDRNTTGLVLFAKNVNSLNLLLEKIKDKEIEKYYKCIVYGIPKLKQATLTAYLFKDDKKSIVYITDNFQKGSKKIITEYKVLSSNVNNNTSVLEVLLHTGRTHQIRAHLAHIGFPIIGDRKIWF